MVIDIAVLFIIAVFFIIGVIDGFIVSVLGLAAWLVGIISVWLFSGVLGSLLVSNVSDLSPLVARVIGGILAFLLPFILISLASSIIGFFVKKAAPLRFVNRLLGGAFGIVKGLAVSLVLLTVVHILPVQGSLKIARDYSTAYSIYKSIPFAELWDEFKPALPTQSPPSSV
ncbi:hypothetical protein AGMMS49938_02150 [Fibrobacterales bacterium]|nr:hypothetical protein AGMMS49938_02150 [Fibrobacterales bacterium]